MNKFYYNKKVVVDFVVNLLTLTLLTVLWKIKVFPNRVLTIFWLRVIS